MKFLSFRKFFLRKIEGECSKYELHYGDGKKATRFVESPLNGRESIGSLGYVDFSNSTLEILIEHTRRMDRLISRLEECVERLKREIQYRNGFKF